MEANKILSADILDIVFDGKNKMYGAYELRKNYSSRLMKSMLIMFAALMPVVYYLFNGPDNKDLIEGIPYEIPDVHLINRNADVPVKKPLIVKAKSPGKKGRSSVIEIVVHQPLQ
jgi:protein TonB